MKFARILTLSLLVASLFALASCGGGETPVSKLEGKWVLALDETINASPAMKSQIPDGEAGQMARKMLETVLGNMTLTFDVKAKTLSGNMMGQEMDKTPFEVVKESGDTVDLKINGNTLNVTVKGATLEIGAPDGKLVFKRP